MADEVDYSRAEKGRRETLEGVVQQLIYLIELHGKPRVEEVVSRNGFKQSRFERVNRILALLDTHEARRNDARDGARFALAEEQRARTELKAIKRDLDLSLLDYFADTAEPVVTAAAFNAGESLGNSTPKISGFFARISDSLQKVSPALAEYNDGRDLYAEATDARTRLDKAQAVQEVGIRMLPAETLTIQALKGEALDLIERFNRAGKRGFKGDAQMIGLFNKDLILRARKQKPTSKQPSSSEQPEEPTGT